MGKVILYSTHCPRCKVLEAKLKQKNIDYTEVNDVEQMKAKSFQEAPKLEVDETIMGFQEAVKWIGEQ
jgi:glutaredoxin-related protein